MVKMVVTGGIACGKSLVGALLAREGVAVLDADDVARELMQPGRPAFDATVRAFGPGILDGTGTIDRGRLAERVFSHPEDLAKLNAAVHPEVWRECRAWLAGQGQRGRAAALIVPLLFETGAEEGWDAVVCVAASEATQMRRLRERGLPEEAARKRMAAQMPVARKAEKADFVIVNDGTKEALEEQTLRVLRRIGARKRDKQ
jgi:dephospho-CoA kinase